MATKILGLDLGTNSIGWSIRDTETTEDNQIIDYGVTVFRKGVGDGKSGEFSLAAERRKNRGKRRLYNAKRYRKWELLKVLIENDMCPLTIDELRLWSIGNWQVVDGKHKNLGRIYPIENKIFLQWLAFDPIYFGDKGTSEKGNTLRKNPYDIRCELIEKFEENERTRNSKVGRALYHLVQRRGFKSNRKNGKSIYAENEKLNQLKAENPNFQIALLAKDRIDKGERFRSSGVIQRKYFEDEFYAICKVQNIDDELTDKLHKAIYFVRPLRTQKGLVGTCTLEKGKPRIPISHPKYEEFRALQFINNIQWRETGTRNFSPIPMQLRKRIFEELFFRKLEKGANKGKVSTKDYFSFEEIVKQYSNSYKYEFNFAKYNTKKLREEGKYELTKNPSVSICPVIAGLMNVFAETWQNKFIENENSIGINWEGLTLSYRVKYGKKQDQQKILKVDEIWHLLFDYLQTKDNEKELESFCKNVLEWNDETTDQFADIDLQQGYGSLSYNAISKILPFLRQGYIYTTAVVYANLKQVLGDKFDFHNEEAKRVITRTKTGIDTTKERLILVNGLIQKIFVELGAANAKTISDHKIDKAHYDVLDYLRVYLGVDEWEKMPENDRQSYITSITDLYVKFLEGTQAKEEKASAKENHEPERDYYRLPRLDDAIKYNLKQAFNIPDTKLRHLYHPSDIEMYNPNSVTEKDVIIDDKKRTVKQLGSPQPPSKGWKNPMAMRTMHELRKLLNYLLQIGKIDPETKIVIEMARELNDANRRWAIENYQRYREEENKEFAKAIVGVAKGKYPNLDENSIDNINQVRLWWEQLPNSEDIYKQIKTLKEDIEKYRLWREQECQCIYTGRTINLTDLFDGTTTNIDHTLPISDSFDDSLSNKTVADADYNQKIKKDIIPTRLPNYDHDAIGYTAIMPRLNKWEEKVKHLQELIEDNKLRTKKAQDPETKKENIQKRRLKELELEYWEKKLKTFTLKEIPNAWKNSQLVDTQIISKYARAYLKTLFEKVDVQKARVVNDFKTIYQIKGDEQKDRSKHSHHAIDAATLTLIPSSARREAILKEYYWAKGHNKNYHVTPYKDFQTTHILNIENDILINHVTQDKAITDTRKNIRKRGVVVFLRDKKTKRYLLDENNKKIPLTATGNTIRGQINEESYLGTIIPPERNSEGLAFKEKGEWKTKTDKKGHPEIWIVKRILIADIDLKKDVIIDEPLKKHIVKQIDAGKSINEITDFDGKIIRHVRCRVKTGRGFQSLEKTIELKRHSHLSAKPYKHYVRSKIADNFLCLFYENIEEKRPIRDVRILSLFAFNELGFDSLKEFYRHSEWSLIKTNNDSSLPLKKIIKVGQRVLFYEHSKDELREFTKDELHNRMFIVFKFNESIVSGNSYNYIFFKNHIDARPNPEIDKDCEDKFIAEKTQAGLCLKPENMDCIFEGKDFEFKPDGQIVFKE